LLKLLNLTASKETKFVDLNEKKEMSLEEFVKITQSPDTGWMRKPGLASRWDGQQGSVIDRKILVPLKQLGILSSADLKQDIYDAAVILGTSTPNMAKRFFALKDYLKKGMQFNKIFLMGSLELDFGHIWTLPEFARGIPSFLANKVEMQSYIRPQIE